MDYQLGVVFHTAPYNEHQSVQTITGKSVQYTSLGLITQCLSSPIWQATLEKMLRVTRKLFDLGLLGYHTRTYRVFIAES